MSSLTLLLSLLLLSTSSSASQCVECRRSKVSSTTNKSLCRPKCDIQCPRSDICGQSNRTRSQIYSTANRLVHERWLVASILLLTTDSIVAACSLYIACLPSLGLGRLLSNSLARLHHMVSNISHCQYISRNLAWIHFSLSLNRLVVEVAIWVIGVVHLTIARLVLPRLLLVWCSVLFAIQWGFLLLVYVHV